MATKEANARIIELLLKRDGDICTWCGERLEEPIEIDHIKPVSKGGGNEMENKQLLHRSCNKKKRDSWTDTPARGSSWGLVRWILIFGAIVIALVVGLAFS